MQEILQFEEQLEQSARISIGNRLKGGFSLNSNWGTLD
jgi:hypothetical protein